MDDKEIAVPASSRIGVFGMGGSGKTLLLKRALNDKQVQQHFEKDLILWLTVSHNLSIINLRNNLGRQINLHINEGFDVRWSEEDVRRWIHEKMSSRRFLLFLDDIWDDSETLLEMLGVPDDQVNGSSKIVVSTRDRRVLSKMRVSNPISMDYLSPEESWRLFCFHAFVDNQHTPHVGIEKIARDVCAECDRLPLALKVIGAAMAGITAPSEWRLTLEKLQNADKLDPQVEKKLYNRLRLSYDALCTPQFLLCSSAFSTSELSKRTRICMWRM
jgi:disease resistance protein RPS2